MEPLPTPDPSGDLGPGGPMGEDDEPALAGWLAEVEGRLTAIDARLAHLESSLRPAVAEEVQGATSELRRAITELGRRLVTDLPHELARHRDAIVAELRPPPPPPPPLPDPEVDDAPLVATSSPAVVPDTTDAPEADDRPRASRRRRRHG